MAQRPDDWPEGSTWTYTDGATGRKYVDGKLVEDRDGPVEAPSVRQPVPDNLTAALEVLRPRIPAGGYLRQG